MNCHQGTLLLLLLLCPSCSWCQGVLLLPSKLMALLLLLLALVVHAELFHVMLARVLLVPGRLVWHQWLGTAWAWACHPANVVSRWRWCSSTIAIVGLQPSVTVVWNEWVIDGEINPGQQLQHSNCQHHQLPNTAMRTMHGNTLQAAACSTHVHQSILDGYSLFLLVMVSITCAWLQ